MEFPVKLLLTPVMILWMLLLLTVVMSWRQHRRLPRLATISLLLFWLFSTKPLVDQLVIPLELAYPAFATASSKQPLAHIMVLGCNHQDSSFLPLSSRPEPCSLARLSEGIRLWHQQPQAFLHFSGHIEDRIQSHTEFARQYAIAMGVSPDKIITHNKPTNTRAEAQALVKSIMHQPAALVTSAMHMPRSCNWFAHYGGQVIAAPTDFHLRRYTKDIGWQSWLPSAQSLDTLSYAFYEYMGLVQQYVQLMGNQPNAVEPKGHPGCLVPDTSSR
ncbi:MAG: YdcF family protein [Gammaproteobacteria bacterium]|nr:YdcF family protein [Gammaproteobacteria bacterium]